MASRTRLGAYNAPFPYPKAAWAPDGHHVLVSWDGWNGEGRGERGTCAWDFIRPEEPPSVFTIDVGPGAFFRCWSPDGASYFSVKALTGSTRNGPGPTALEERRTADGSLLRTVVLGLDAGFSATCVSPDAHAMVLYSIRRASSRIIVLD